MNDQQTRGFAFEVLHDYLRDLQEMMADPETNEIMIPSPNLSPSLFLNKSPLTTRHMQEDYHRHAIQAYLSSQQPTLTPHSAWGDLEAADRRWSSRYLGEHSLSFGTSCGTAALRSS